MVKLFTLLIILGLCFSSLYGYLILTEKISTGEQQIAAGEKALAEGQDMLNKGKARLAKGQRKLSQAKGMYSGISRIPFMGIVSELPVTGMAFKQASNEIAAGDVQVAHGQMKIKSGEGQIETGKLTLNQGKERLIRANKIRAACLLGVGLFAALELLLGYCWRRSLGAMMRRVKI